MDLVAVPFVTDLGCFGWILVTARGDERDSAGGAISARGSLGCVEHADFWWEDSAGNAGGCRGRPVGIFTRDR